MSLRRRINEIRNDPWWRFQARSTEHCLQHRGLIILGHIERMGEIEALLLGRAG